MYTPPFNRIDDAADIRRLVAAVGTAWLVTSGPDGRPRATFLPIVWRDDTVVTHMAKANPHWREITPGTPALLVVTGPDAYVSPSWYAAKAEHGKVVPTWNYRAAQLTGSVHIRHDHEWLRAVVTELTDAHERDREQPWQVTDPPTDYIDGQLGGIVGVEIPITAVVGKAKLSQNRSLADRRGVIAGLRTEPNRSGPDVATAMATEPDVAERATSGPPPVDGAVARPGNHADVDAVLAFWQLAAEDTDRPADRREAVAQLIARDPDALLLVLDGERIIGGVIAGWDGWRAHIYRLAVHPDYRRRGLARWLVTAAEHRLRGHGAIRGDAMVLDDNPSAHGLWSAAGYVAQPNWSRWVRPL